MLKIIIPPVELFDEAKQEFLYSKGYDLRLEHSLVSLSKWEAKWQKPFLTKTDKTDEETVDYIRCMTITQNVDPIAYKHISQANIDRIVKYIDDPMTATILPKENGASNKETITSELIYYWMISFNIPFECQTWHLNRLLTLINVCNVKNQPKKKISKSDLLARNKALNEQRKAKLNTSG
jgi:hypothetical protein